MVTKRKTETNKQTKKWRNQLLVRFLNRQAHDELVISVDLFSAPNTKKKLKKLASRHAKAEFIKCGLLSCFVFTTIWSYLFCFNMNFHVKHPWIPTNFADSPVGRPHLIWYGQGKAKKKNPGSFRYWISNAQWCFSAGQLQSEKKYV